MHPVSRKQARTTMRMQSLQPELDKLKEKYKDDKQALQMAQMELYRKHGINPLGSCWMMFLQMPVFLGLYYCLQESIHFRLAPFFVDPEPDGAGHAGPLGRQDPVHQPAGKTTGRCTIWGRTSTCCRCSPSC